MVLLLSLPGLQQSRLMVGGELCWMAECGSNNVFVSLEDMPRNLRGFFTFMKKKKKCFISFLKKN